MERFIAIKRDVKKSGEWKRGFGYSNRLLTITKQNVWCVMKDGKTFAETRGKGSALLVAELLNKEDQKDA